MNNSDSEEPEETLAIVSCRSLMRQIRDSERAIRAGEKGSTAQELRDALLGGADAAE